MLAIIINLAITELQLRPGIKLDREVQAKNLHPIDQVTDLDLAVQAVKTIIVLAKDLQTGQALTDRPHDLGLLQGIVDELMNSQISPRPTILLAFFISHQLY